MGKEYYLYMYLKLVFPAGGQYYRVSRVGKDCQSWMITPHQLHNHMEQ